MNFLRRPSPAWSRRLPSSKPIRHVSPRPWHGRASAGCTSLSPWHSPTSSGASCLWRDTHVRLTPQIRSVISVSSGPSGRTLLRACTSCSRVIWPTSSIPSSCCRLPSGPPAQADCTRHWHESSGDCSTGSSPNKREAGQVRAMSQPTAKLGHLPRILGSLRCLTISSTTRRMTTNMFQESSFPVTDWDRVLGALAFSTTSRMASTRWARRTRRRTTPRGLRRNPCGRCRQRTTGRRQELLQKVKVEAAKVGAATVDEHDTATPLQPLPARRLPGLCGTTMLGTQMSVTTASGQLLFPSLRPFPCPRHFRWQQPCLGVGTNPPLWSLLPATPPSTVGFQGCSPSMS
mmetsp:Transcript_52408/g.139527  ORF Transcript_52408/g.139527 Transcript_52408/m.139527 type:complete len:346 (-) Transcript_52408:1432-2469(-)